MLDFHERPVYQRDTKTVRRVNIRDKECQSDYLYIAIPSIYHIIAL